MKIRYRVPPVESVWRGGETQSKSVKKYRSTTQTTQAPRDQLISLRGSGSFASCWLLVKQWSWCAVGVKEVGHCLVSTVTPRSWYTVAIASILCFRAEMRPICLSLYIHVVIMLVAEMREVSDVPFTVAVGPHFTEGHINGFGSYLLRD
jgi:hypothetical protein